MVEPMELSERLAKFLGKPDTDPDFQAFLSEFEPFLRETASNGRARYSFPQLGFTITQNGSMGGIAAIHFHVFTRSVRIGEYKRYAGMLPSGILTSDSRADVSSKLGVDPVRSTPYEGYPDKVPNPSEEYPTWWDKYKIPPLGITIIFRSPIGDMDIFGVNYLPLYQKLETDRRQRGDAESGEQPE